VASQESKVDKLTFLPRFKAIDTLVHNIERKFFHIEPGQYIPEEAITRFNQHNEEVEATVPPERLLVFNVEEGWEPLCKFLGVPVPNEPFPHENAGTANVDQIMFNMMLKIYSSGDCPSWLVWQ
jgi:hypothetical protein